MSKEPVSSTDRIREKKRRFQTREQRIVDASLKLLIKHGVDKVTVSAIARDAGVGKGTVYKHFLTKTEILMRIMLGYERNITAHLREGIEAAKDGDPGAAARSYFKARLENPALDRLVQQLEVRLESNADVKEQMDELHLIRRSNTNELNNMIERSIAKGALEDVPPYYHSLSCWALAQGAVELFANATYSPEVENMDDLLKFISSIGVTMGNVGQLRESKPVKHDD